MSTRKRASRPTPIKAKVLAAPSGDPRALALQDWIGDVLADDVLEWIVQEDPEGHQFSARAHTMFGHEPLELILCGDSLESVRRLLPPKLLTLPRLPEETHPTLIETWF